jgi:hypothetical protein
MNEIERTNFFPGKNRHLSYICKPRHVGERYLGFLDLNLPALVPKTEWDLAVGEYYVQGWDVLLMLPNVVIVNNDWDWEFCSLRSGELITPLSSM